MNTIGEMELNQLFEIMERRKFKEEKERERKEQEDLQKLLGFM